MPPLCLGVPGTRYALGCRARVGGDRAASKSWRWIPFLTNILILSSVDPFTKKEWYDIKAPNMFSIRQVGKTLATKTQGLKNSRDSLIGRVFEVSLGDLKTKVQFHYTARFARALPSACTWGRRCAGARVQSVAPCWRKL